MDALSRMAIFVEVARFQSFAGAARELGITVSAVSRQVRNLEASLNVRLFNRTTRKVSLTEEGSVLFERASRALSDLAEATEEINELKSTPRGLLRISIPTALGTQYLKQPIAEFACNYPEVTLDVQFDDRLVDMAEEGFDLVLRLAPLDDSSMVARKLAPAPLGLFCSPGYLEKNGSPSLPADLVNHNVVAYTRNRGAHEWRYRSPSGEEGVVALKSTFRCDYVDMMIEVACQGIGILICPAIYVQQELRSGGLVTLLPEYSTIPERNLWAVFHPNRYMSTRLRLFVDHMVEYCRKHLQPD